MSTEGQDSDGGLSASADTVTQETRFTLIQNIVSHPEGLPSLEELVFMNPQKSKSTIREHLDKLADAGIVESVKLPETQRQRDLPYRFFRITDTGREFLESHDLLRSEDTLGEMWKMLEKPPHIQKYAEAPRPEVSGDTEAEA